MSMRSFKRNPRCATTSVGRRPRALPEEYSCIDPNEAVQLFDYLNGADKSADKALLSAHLGLCYSCQDAADAMMKLDKAVKERRAELKEVAV